MDGDDFNLFHARVAIVGLGLMGGSLALALKGKCAALLGVDPDPAVRELALRKRIVAQAGAEPEAILAQADVIILAAPVPAIIDWLGRLPGMIPQACIVLDLGSSKRDILAAMAGLPERFDPIGGHPLCGKERLSLENADPALFAGAQFFLVPLDRTTPRARACAEQILAVIGSQAQVVDAAAHDAVLAITSHLPYLLGSALALSTPGDAASFVGTGFRSTARLAGTPQSMMLGVLRTNRENVLEAVRIFQEQLSALARALDEDDPQALGALLASARDRYTHLVP